MQFKSLPNNEKPRERLKLYGKENLSNEELLQILIKCGSRKYSVKDISISILSKVGDLSNLKNYTLNTLQDIEGMSEIKSLELLAALELGRRVYAQTPPEPLLNCTDPETIITYFHDLLKDQKQENFYVLYLDNKKKYLDKKLLFKGTINASIAHPREIFKEAYLLSASYIICIHNHPSGDPTPSGEDTILTHKLTQIASLHAIPLLDHLIIGTGSYYSYYADGNLTA